jgi:hypothetical protein
VSFVSTGVTRTYTSFSQLDREIIDARVWGAFTSAKLMRTPALSGAR